MSNDAAPQPKLVRLRDGSLVTIGPRREEDATPLWVFLSGLCAQGHWLLFLSGVIDTTKAYRWAADTDTGRWGFVAYDETAMIVGPAVYILLGPTGAQWAVEVADHLPGRSLRTDPHRAPGGHRGAARGHTLSGTTARKCVSHMLRGRPCR